MPIATKQSKFSFVLSFASVSQRLFNVYGVIDQLYQGKNKLHLDEMLMMSALYVILILNPVFAFTPFFCVRYLVENQQISIFL
jgi:hypothetical protein